MKIATSFSTYFEETNDAEQALNQAKNDGFDAMGIMISEPIEYYNKFIQQFNNSDLTFCIHSNLTDTNLASSNQGIRAESLKQLKEAIILAKEINAKVVTFHPGKFRNALRIQEAYLFLDESIKEALKTAEENNIILCIENMEPRSKDLGVSLSQVEKILERHPKLMLTLDLAHVALHVSSEEELIEYYESFKNRIKHFHISGIQPNRSHVEVSLKESDINFTNILKKLKDYDGIIRIENREYHKNIESLEFIRQAIQ